MENMELRPIGRVRSDGDGMRVALDAGLAPALTGLEGFDHVQVLCWFSGAADEASRAALTVEAPYRGGPGALGVFATRGPSRPNPLALSCARLLAVDAARAVLWVDYIDMEDGTPVLDIKPYTPSLDRVERPGTPAWCADWPGSREAAAEFDWSAVFDG